MTRAPNFQSLTFRSRRARPQALATRLAGVAATPRARIDLAVLLLAVGGLWLGFELAGLRAGALAWIAAHDRVGAGLSLLLLAALGTAVFARRRAGDPRDEPVSQRLAEMRLKDITFTDQLTGLPNRRALHERLARLDGAAERGLTTILLMIDLVRFRAVVESHGQPVADRLLRLVASRLREDRRPGQSVYRLGDDEFALVLESQSDDPDLPARISGRIVELMSQPFIDGTVVHGIGATVGSAAHPRDAADREALLRRADAALQHAMAMGGGRHGAFDRSMDRDLARRARIEREIGGAIRNGDIRPYVQPMVDLATGRTLGYEILARWIRRDGSAVTPDLFLPVAEEAGLITDLTTALLRRTCLEARAWDPGLVVSVNLAISEFRNPDLADRILVTLGETGLPASRLSVEVTEDALAEGGDAVLRTLDAFRRGGVRIALDDFGTGASSLGLLQSLHLDRIKIDRTFVLAMASDPSAARIVRGMTQLGRSLDIPVLAEGIETEASLQELRAFGCTQGQGFLLGHPIPAEEVAPGRARTRAA